MFQPQTDSKNENAETDDALSDCII